MPSLPSPRNFSFLRGASLAGRAGDGGEPARACRHRHRRPQHARRRGARLCRARPSRSAGEEAETPGRRAARHSSTARPTSWPIRATAKAYGRLCRLLTQGKLLAKKGECHASLRGSGRTCARTYCSRWFRRQRPDEDTTRASRDTSKASAPDGVWLAAAMLYRGDDRRRLEKLKILAAAAMCRCWRSTMCSITPASAARCRMCSPASARRRRSRPPDGNWKPMPNGI